MTEEVEHRKSHHVLWFITAGFLLIGIAFFALWFFDWRYQETTEDAYVHGNQVVVTPQISGYITSITVDDTEVVKEGRILIKLDPTDRKIALEGAKNALAETVRNVGQMFENVGVNKGIVEKRKAEFAKAAKDYQHRKKLVKSGGVSVEEFQHAEAAFIASFAAYLSARHALRGAQTLVENTTIKTHPLVEKASDTLREAYVNLERCTIRSPTDGMVAMKKGQVGEAINPSTPLMTIIPLNQIWVDANFKENQLKKVRIGQRVDLTSEIYGRDVRYRGEVIGIAAATGSVMSVLPPQNATGNWIKIVQRLPVRVKLDPSQLEKHPLRLGLSMKARVDITDTSGVMIPASPPEGALYATDIFDKQEAGAEPLISKIIKENSTFSFDEEGKVDAS